MPALRTICTDDYAVIDAGQPVGRIRRAGERQGEVWMWNVTLPTPGAPGNTDGSLDAAKAAFREAWSAFKASIGEKGLAEAIQTQCDTVDKRHHLT
jgi:hypothetical protein